MFLKSHRFILGSLLLVHSIALEACLAEPGLQDAPSTGGATPGPGPGGSEPGSNVPTAAEEHPGPPASRQVIESEKSNLRYKDGRRYGKDLATALGLEESTQCLELGRYACIAGVHNITLGGVEPYMAAIYDPLPSTGITTPIAADRIALSACEQRATRDFGDARTALIFKGLAMDEKGALANPSGTEAAAVINTLYERLLRRAASASEIADLVAFYGEIQDIGGFAPARNWATLSCFAIATSVEAMFY